MKLFNIAASLFTAATICSFINYKFIKLPSSIGMLILAMIVSLSGILLNKLGIISSYSIDNILSNINFKETVFHGMLSFLLFAGALQVDINDLKKNKTTIAIIAVISTLISTIIIGISFYFVATLLGFRINLVMSFLFGAILSPTDPIAIMSIIRKLRISKTLETTIVGESLFNDGVSIVLFLGLIEIIQSGTNVDYGNVFGFFIFEVGGGILFGSLIGWLAYQLLRKTDNYNVELFITLSITTGGYALADNFQFSAPLAMVIAGIIIGNRGRSHAMSNETRKYIDNFWEAIEEILNAILFFLIGLEMIVISATWEIIILGFICIFIALLARLISIALPLIIFKPSYAKKPGYIILLTWAGLRGALSIAMVLTLDSSNTKIILLPCIYIVVVFSIIVQGLSLTKVFKYYSTHTTPLAKARGIANSCEITTGK